MSVVEHRLFPPKPTCYRWSLRATRGRASKYRPGRGLNQEKGGYDRRAGSGCCAHSRRGCRVRYNNEKLSVWLMRQSLPRPSGRLVPVATSSVRLVGSTVTERLGWLAWARPGDPCQGPWL